MFPESRLVLGLGTRRALSAMVASCRPTAFQSDRHDSQLACRLECMNYSAVLPLVECLRALPAPSEATHFAGKNVLEPSRADCRQRRGIHVTIAKQWPPVAGYRPMNSAADAVESAAIPPCHKHHLAAGPKQSMSPLARQRHGWRFALEHFRRWAALEPAPTRRRRSSWG